MKYKIVAVSDLHGTLPKIPPCDLLLIAGDIAPIFDHDLHFQSRWLSTDFRYWLQALPAEQIVYIAGNHDLVFQQIPELVPKDLPAVYLQDSGFAWRGLKIWGTPWQPWFFDWAFNLFEPDLKQKWDLIPDNTDILLVHGPPYRHGDGIPERQGMRHAGSPSLLEKVLAIKPRLVVFGHIHEGRGEWKIGETVLANVTILNEAYNHVHAPWECEWEATS